MPRRHIEKALHRVRFLPYAIALAVVEAKPAEAQTVSTTKTNTISLFQDFVDLMIAGAGVAGIYFLIRAGMAISKTGVDADREKRSHNILSDIGAGVFLFAVGIVIYEVKTQVFGSGGSGPSLTAPSITPSAG